jgi:hypothetical protein
MKGTRLLGRGVRLWVTEVLVEGRRSGTCTAAGWKKGPD